MNVDLPKGASISISPADFAKLRTLKRELVTKAAATAEPDTEKRDIGEADRRRIADEGNAVRNADGHISYPIENTGDLQNAATLARSGHGDVAAARRLIARRARELGVAESPRRGRRREARRTSRRDEPLRSADCPEAQDCREPPDALKEAEPEVTKDPEPEDAAPKAKKAKRRPKKGRRRCPRG